ncbi:CCR4-NOT transcription complex subunit 6-like isoform X2 [Lasioglossum baleicum]|uniref:CCR4-NOT transcription complex subunit 6-like isoform X2 n=1 Tax=Lasioglossum baleicum TaxID=434251 RepID=UPI003FCCA3A3
MSRNHKDKYENSNPRRTHTFMSTEDANSGKKSYWPELEITGSIRNLSPNLWQLTHLTALYLNDNSLQRIPAEIGRMANLRALDLSSNKLRSLPAELGDLIYLRELLLNQNYLRVLPYELGKLFQLKVLGLQGNPLSKEVMALYGEPSGTSKLLSYMLDNLQGMCQVFIQLCYITHCFLLTGMCYLFLTFLYYYNTTFHNIQYSYLKISMCAFISQTYINGTLCKEWKLNVGIQSFEFWVILGILWITKMFERTDSSDSQRLLQRKSIQLSAAII